ncbi:SDR family NAD(P)-dependent oxidoreductase [Cupriavidus basilensis]
MGGLGEAISVKLHDVGYTTIVTHSPTNPGVEAWLARMAAEGRRFQAYTVDVADYDSCQQCVEKIQGEIGPVDILINNAGITRDTSFKKLDKVNWDAVIRTNLDSVFNMTKPVCDGMVERGWGRIINVSSIIGSKGGFGQTNYAAAKAGMHGFTKSLALEVAKRGVTVNTISPGGIPQRRSRRCRRRFWTLRSFRRSRLVAWATGGNRRARVVLVLARGRLRDRGQYRHQRRSAPAVTSPDPQGCGGPGLQPVRRWADAARPGQVRERALCHRGRAGPGRHGDCLR